MSERIFIAADRQFPAGGEGGDCHSQVYDETANAWQVVVKPHRNSVALFGVDGKLYAICADLYVSDCSS